MKHRRRHDYWNVFNRRLPDPTLIRYVCSKLDHELFFGRGSFPSLDEWRASR